MTRRWQAVLHRWRRALRGSVPAGGRDGWCRPETIDGLRLERAGDRPPRVGIVVNERWPLSIVPPYVDVDEGRLPLQALRAPAVRAQCALVHAVPGVAGAPAPLGTLGFLASDAFDAGITFAVTAGHVLGGSVRAAFDDPVVIEVPQPALRIDRARIAEWSTPLSSGSVFRIDAGLARLTPADRQRLLQALAPVLADDVGPTPAQGDAISLLRADGSRLNGASGVGAAAETRVLAARLNADGSIEETELRIGLLQTCRLDPAPQAGDSGAAVLDASNRLVGIHCAYSATADPGAANAFYTRVDDIAGHFGLVPLTRRSLAQPLPVQPRPALVNAAPRPPVVPVPAAPAAPPARSAEVDTLARTLWAEARGEGQEGMEAVACVVLNRAARGGWWGDTITSVCRMPYQFSCWNPGTRSLRELLQVTSADTHFALALDIAERAAAGQLADFTKGALHYHTRSARPGWSRGLVPCFELGRHVFFNNVR